ncbi:UPF1 [Symbiodinium sp. CCMP2592]|nr:UPF1 [Symbiodinium sp. CCMP2592]
MFETFIRANGNKDQFIRRFTLKKVSEKTSELDEEGGYYTPDEMKKNLNYSQTDLVDKSIKYYWCRTRVKGLKRLRQTQAMEETMEAEGTGAMDISGMDVNGVTARNMGLQTAADIESAKTEAEKLEIQQKELLSVQEKCSALMDKLALINNPEKKERATASRGKLDLMAKSAEKIYERMADATAKLHTDLGVKSTNYRCSMWTGLERTCRPLPQRKQPLLRKPPKKKEEEEDKSAGSEGDIQVHGCYKQLEMFKPSVRHLPRLQQLLLDGLGNDDRVKLCLPPPLLNAGKALLSIRERVASILRLGPTVYKIGLTGDPLFRFYKVPSKTNSSAGYRYDIDQYAEMQVLFAGATWDEAALMEAVLISEFQGRPGNRNINPGGEGRQVYDPPYFTYIVFKSALVAPKRQRIYAQGGKKVPCSKMVGLAKAMKADGLATSAGGFIHEMSKISEKNAEGQAHKLLNKHKLSLPIPLRGIHGDPAIAGFPRLKPSDIFQFMADSGHLNKLLGGRSLQNSHLLLLSFWENYRAIHPDFELFSSHHSDIPLEECIPIVAHIDGGRGYKKSEFMIFNWGAVIGSGSGKKNKKDPAVRAFGVSGYKMQLPLLGHSYTTHFLYAAMPSSWHKNSETSFQALLRTFAEDLRECFDDGISWKGRVLRLVCIGLKGDLKLQARAGRLVRWFTTARKAPYSETAKGSGQCCWLCSAGDVSAPFEEIQSESPAWLQQMPTFTEPPWQPGLEGGMLRPSLSYMDRPAKFYLADLFHVYLAGVGQDFCSSCLVYMLSNLFAGPPGNNSVDAQIENLNAVFRNWRVAKKEAVHLTAFTRDKLQFFDATSAFPSGSWSKAADTARITKFILYMCETHRDTCKDDKIMLYIYRAASAISRFMQALYACDLWMDSELHEPPEVAPIVADGFRFLRCYSKLATLALAQGKPLWPYRPKIHVLHHFIIDMKQACDMGTPALNPLSVSCSQAEDFIGRTALLSRRVAANTAQGRVLQRWLAGAMQQWVRA